MDVSGKEGASVREDLQLIILPVIRAILILIHIGAGGSNAGKCHGMSIFTCQSLTPTGIPSAELGRHYPYQQRPGWKQRPCSGKSAMLVYSPTLRAPGFRDGSRYMHVCISLAQDPAMYICKTYTVQSA